MSSQTLTIYIDQLPDHRFCAYLQELPGLIRVNGRSLPEVYREMCYQVAYLIQERTDQSELRIKTQLSSSARAQVEAHQRKSGAMVD
jgi:hypothetical protein